MINNYPSDLLYTPSHEWVRIEDEQTVTIGITEYAQHALGDLVYVELPKLDTSVQVGQNIAVVESVKTAADVYSPLVGEIVVINKDLQQTPGLINTDPYGAGWIFRLRIKSITEVRAMLLEPHKYQALVESSSNSR